MGLWLIVGFDFAVGLMDGFRFYGFLVMGLLAWVCGYGFAGMGLCWLGFVGMGMPTWVCGGSVVWWRLGFVVAWGLWVWVCRHGFVVAWVCGGLVVWWLGFVGMVLPAWVCGGSVVALCSVWWVCGGPILAVGLRWLWVVDFFGVD